MTASDSTFDSMGGFSGSSYSIKTAEIECLTGVAMVINFGTRLAVNGLRRKITTWGFRIKDGLFSVNPYLCWLLTLD